MYRPLLYRVVESQTFPIISRLGPERTITILKEARTPLQRSHPSRGLSRGQAMRRAPPFQSSDKTGRLSRKELRFAPGRELVETSVKTVARKARGGLENQSKRREKNVQKEANSGRDRRVWWFAENHIQKTTWWGEGGVSQKNTNTARGSFTSNPSPALKAKNKVPEVGSEEKKP